MDSIFFWLGALVVVTLLSPLLKFVIAAVGGKWIGAEVLAAQPDAIRLVEPQGESRSDAAAMRRPIDELARLGFRDAGLHAIAEMPGVLVHLLAHPDEGFYGAVYHHPQAGVWFDVCLRCQDGSSITWTTSKPTGLDPRPGHPMVNLPGQSPAAVFEKARTTRPRRPLTPASTNQAVTIFEQAYAESTAWRKGKGIGTAEVIKVAKAA
jgi:hypothetical protein